MGIVISRMDCHRQIAQVVATGYYPKGRLNMELPRKEQVGETGLMRNGADDGDDDDMKNCMQIENLNVSLKLRLFCKDMKRQY